MWIFFPPPATFCTMMCWTACCLGFINKDWSDSWFFSPFLPDSTQRCHPDTSLVGWRGEAGRRIQTHHKHSGENPDNLSSPPRSARKKKKHMYHCICCGSGFRELHDASMNNQPWTPLMWSPAPSCRRCERHPAGSGELWSGPLVFLTAHFCGGPRNLPAWEGVPSRSEACGWTSDCKTSKRLKSRQQTRNSLGHVIISVHRLGFTSDRDSSWASAQRHLLPRGTRTCSRCSAASALMSPRVCCYRCWGWLLPGSLFSNTPPSTTNQHQWAVGARGCTGALSAAVLR